jgi:Fic family protein
MRIPRTPPKVFEILKAETRTTLFGRLGDPDVADFVRRANDGYIHWDKLRYHSLPNGLDIEMSWAAVWLSRFQQFQPIPIRFNGGDQIKYWNPPQHLDWLHRIDQKAGGVLGSTSSIHVGTENHERYLINALMEEAIASSQLEGAVTTRRVAKQMLREGRRPKNRAERMIFNNYNAILRIRDCKSDDLTLALLKELHSILTTDTLEDSTGEGHFRVAGDNVVVEDSSTHEVLHTPPSAVSLDERIEEICNFANQRSKPFIHPVTKAIVLHFALGYVHPFVDGNGRTARAVFYWFMLKHGYWLFEFLPISRLFLQAPAKYARSYLYTETDAGDVTYFIHYNLWVILRAIQDFHGYLVNQQEKISEAAKLLRSAPDLNHRQESLISHALRNPDASYTIQEHQGTHRVCYATARADLMQLADAGYLTLVRKKKRILFSPHAELLRQLKKLSSSISKPLTKTRTSLHPIAVTRVQTDEPDRTLFALGDDGSNADSAKTDSASDRPLGHDQPREAEFNERAEE